MITIVNNQGVKYNISNRDDMVNFYKIEGFNKYDIDVITSFSQVEFNCILEKTENGELDEVMKDFSMTKEEYEKLYHDEDDESYEQRVKEHYEEVNQPNYDLISKCFVLLFYDDKLSKLCTILGITDGLEGFNRRSSIKEIVFTI